MRRKRLTVEGAPVVVYGLAGPDGAVRYVGQTNDPDYRLYMHRSLGRSAARLPELRHAPVHRWVGEVGPDAVELRVLEICQPGEALAREQHWMDSLDTLTAGVNGRRNFRQNETRPA